MTSLLLLSSTINCCDKTDADAVLFLEHRLLMCFTPLTVCYLYNFIFFNSDYVVSCRHYGASQLLVHLTSYLSFLPYQHWLHLATLSSCDVLVRSGLQVMTVHIHTHNYHLSD